MRVFDKEVTSCADCHLCRTVDDDHMGVHIICGYNGNNVYVHYYNNEINSDCPFSKSLTKEDIESCGFKHSGVDEQAIDRYYKDDISLIYWGKWLNHETTNKCYILKEKDDASGRDMLFHGKILNLPEFKLVLKQLNME